MANSLNRYLGCGLFIAASCVAVACDGPRSAPGREMHLGTDGASAPLSEGLLNAFEVQYPDTVFSVRQDSREAVLQSVENGDLDAAILFWPLSGSALFSTPIAEQPIVLIVDHENPLEEISLHDARAALAGRIASWDALDGPNLPITLITYPSENSTRLALDAMLLDVNPIGPAARTASDEVSVITLVTDSEGSLAYVPFSVLTPDVKPLILEGAAPTLNNSRQRSYPLIGQVVFVSREEPRGFLREYLDWVLSRAGQQVVRRYMLGYND